MTPVTCDLLKQHFIVKNGPIWFSYVNDGLRIMDCKSIFKQPLVQMHVYPCCIQLWILPPFSMFILPSPACHHHHPCLEVTAATASPAFANAFTPSQRISSSPTIAQWLHYNLFFSILVAGNIVQPLPKIALTTITLFSVKEQIFLMPTQNVVLTIHYQMRRSISINLYCFFI